jgi:hypothetical protein
VTTRPLVTDSEELMPNDLKTEDIVVVASGTFVPPKPKPDDEKDKETVKAS